MSEMAMDGLTFTISGQDISRFAYADCSTIDYAIDVRDYIQDYLADQIKQMETKLKEQLYSQAEEPDKEDWAKLLEE